MYEIRRALAKKKFYVLAILTIALQVIVFLAFNFIFANPELGFDFEGLKSTMWILGVLGPQELFMPLIAIVIAGGSMSEEYEYGTADILLTKPIKKTEYMFGKYLGGFTLSIFVIALTTIFGIALAYAFFGLQESILFAPLIYLAMVYSSLLFYSLSFMFSEVSRRTTITILATIGIFVASIIIGSYLSIMYAITQEQIYLNIIMALPNWSVSQFPSFVASEFINVEANPFLSVESGDIQMAAVIIVVYTIVSIITSSLRLNRSDVTKKAT